MGNTLVVVARRGDLPRRELIRRGMIEFSEFAKCDFCNEDCWINKHNLREIKSKGDTPVLVCLPCYEHGNHLKGGYRA